MYVRKVNRVTGVEPRELRCELLKTIANKNAAQDYP